MVGCGGGGASTAPNASYELRFEPNVGTLMYGNVYTLRVWRTDGTPTIVPNPSISISGVTGTEVTVNQGVGTLHVKEPVNGTGTLTARVSGQTVSTIQRPVVQGPTYRMVVRTLVDGQPGQGARLRFFFGVGKAVPDIQESGTSGEISRECPLSCDGFLLYPSPVNAGAFDKASVNGVIYNLSQQGTFVRVTPQPQGGQITVDVSYIP